MGRPFPWNHNCEVIRLTIDDDVTTEQGLKKALEAVSQDDIPTFLMRRLLFVQRIVEHVYFSYEKV